jgi:hypothetical protein
LGITVIGYIPKQGHFGRFQGAVAQKVWKLNIIKAKRFPSVITFPFHQFFELCGQARYFSHLVVALIITS